MKNKEFKNKRNPFPEKCEVSAFFFSNLPNKGIHFPFPFPPLKSLYQSPPKSFAESGVVPKIPFGNFSSILTLIFVHPV